MAEDKRKVQLIFTDRYPTCKTLCIFICRLRNNTCIEIWSTEGWAEEQKYFDNELVEKELIGLGF